MLFFPHPKAWGQAGCTVVSATLTYYADDAIWIGINGHFISGCFMGSNWHTSNCMQGTGSGGNGTGGEGLALSIPATYFYANPTDNVLAVLNDASDGGSNGATWLMTLIDSCGVTQYIESDGTCTVSKYAGNNSGSCTVLSSSGPPTCIALAGWDSPGAGP